MPSTGTEVKRNDSEDPFRWEAPSWHEDYGDTEQELQMLKGFCVTLRKSNPNYSVFLDSSEEGFLCVEIKDARGGPSMELQVVEGQAKGEKRYALFRGEEELYFSDVDEGLAHF